MTTNIGGDRAVKLYDIAHNMSPKRLDKLDAETQVRLKKKYLHALEVLHGTD